MSIYQNNFVSLQTILKGQNQPKTNLREYSSAGSEHLPYKQGVTGSNPVTPTKQQRETFLAVFFVPKII